MSFRSWVTHPSGSNPPIHILDDDSLLNIFYLYRPDILADIDIDVRAGDLDPPKWGEWTCERWWHKLTHVCQRWRRLIFVSASYLGLCLVCTYGTPVAKLLGCFPTLPIILDYPRETLRWTVKDGDGILLALQQRARVRRIRLFVPPSHEVELVKATEMEFPMLEYLFIGVSDRGELRPDLEIHRTFQAPRLRHLVLTRCPFLVTSPSLTTCTGLVTLSLMFLSPQSCHHPYDLFRRLLLLSQLVVLRIGDLDFSTNELEGQQLDIPLFTPLTLPNLRLFEFAGHSNYLETLLPWIKTPVLEKFQTTFAPHLTNPTPPYSLLFLLPFMRKSDVLGFGSAKFLFSGSGATAWVYPREGARVYVFYLRIITRPLGLQVSEMAEIFRDLSPAFSTVEDLTVDYSSHNPLFERVVPMQWRELLRSFNHVKTIRVHGLFAESFSQSLLSDGESLPEALPDLQVLECLVGCDASDTFATYVNVRKAAGYPIRLVLVDSSGHSPPNTSL
jgi:hypothetical protein